MSGNDNRTAYESFVVSGDNTRKKRINDINSGLICFKFLELKKFKFTPFDKEEKRVEIENGEIKPVQNIKKILGDNPYGRMEAAFSDAHFIENKYIYVFQKSHSTGEVSLNCELKGISKSEMRFEKYNKDRNKEGEITELYLGGKLTKENFQFYFILSGFRLTDDRIKVIARQLANSGGSSFVFKKENLTPDRKVRRAALFRHDHIYNDSPFNQIVLKDEHEKPDFFTPQKDSRDDKMKYIVYLTDMVQLSLQAYGRFMEAHSRYLEWLSEAKDEKARKLILLSQIIDNLIVAKGSKATRHLKSFYSESANVKVPFRTAPVDLELNYSRRPKAFGLVDESFLNKLLIKPDKLFQFSEFQQLSDWKRGYEETSLFYFQTTLSLGLALLRIIRAEEYLHQISDFIYGSYQGAGGNEYSLDDIETGKANRDGFNKEEGHAIFSNLVGETTAALSEFHGTAGFVLKDFETSLALLEYIYTGDFNLEQLFREPANITPGNALLVVFILKKATAGLSAALGAALAIGSNLLIKQIESLKIDKDFVDRRLTLFKKLEVEQQNAKKLFEEIREINNSNEKKLAKIIEKRTKVHDWQKKHREYLSELNRGNKVKLEKEWRKHILAEFKEEVVEYINDRFNLKLTLESVKLTEMGELVKVKTAKGNISKSDYFMLISETNKKIESSTLHKSLKRAEENLKEGMTLSIKYNKEKRSQYFKDEKEFKNKDYYAVKENLKLAEEDYDARNLVDKKGVAESATFEANKYEMESQIKKNKLEVIEKWDSLPDKIGILNFVVESVNLYFAGYDSIIKFINSDLTANDVIGLTGSGLDWLSGLFELAEYVSKYKNIAFLSSISKSAKFIKFSQVANRLGGVVGVASGLIDCYLDAKEIKGNWQEGDSWGVTGRAISAYGGYVTAVGSLLTITGGTSAPVIGVVVAAGIIAQLAGTLIDNILGSDEYELWLKHSCWGEKFGKKAKTFTFTIDKPLWAVVDFDHWAYQSGDSEANGEFGWAGRLDAQIDSFTNLIYSFNLAMSACSNIYLGHSDSYNQVTKRMERKLYEPVKAGFIELSFTFPKSFNPLSFFAISLWVESESGKRVNIIDNGALYLVSRGRIEELLKVKELSDPYMSNRLKQIRDGSKHFFGTYKEYDNDKKCLVLKLIDKSINDKEIFSPGTVLGSYEDFFDYKNEDVIRIDGLYKKLSDRKSWKNLVISVTFDVFGNGKLITPLELGELSPKEIRIPVSEIGEKTAAYTSYYSSNPAAYYYDEGDKGQKQGTIDDIK